METIVVYSTENSIRLKFVLDWLLKERLHINYSITSNIDDTTGNCDTGQLETVTERRNSDVGNAFRNRDACQIEAAKEHRIPDVGNTIAKHDIRQTTVNKQTITEAGDAAGKGDAGEAGTSAERILANVRDGVWN